ncbi:MAG TPA: GTPase HflX, partial [Paracoccaceae bacterium]|nr:GTPase HflX [Paracoccaceae bacterium]
MTRTLVLHPAIRGQQGPEDAAARLAEAQALTRALPGLEQVGGETVWLSRPHPATLLGAGKVGEIGARIGAAEIGLVIMNGPLSPVQQRNLEREWKAKVLD